MLSIPQDSLPVLHEMGTLCKQCLVAGQDTDSMFQSPSIETSLVGSFSMQPALNVCSSVPSLWPLVWMTIVICATVITYRAVFGGK